MSEERTYLGPEMDQMVAGFRKNQRRYGVNPDYDLVRENFDHYHFLLQAGHLHQQRQVDPIRVFLRSGSLARNSPHPDFSMQKYLARYPERSDGDERSPYLEWLKRGREAGEVADPADGVEAIAELVGLGKNELVEEVAGIRRDMVERLRTGKLGEMFANAVEIEPLIGEAWVDAITRPKQLPLRNESVTTAAAAIYACHKDAQFRVAGTVIVTDRPSEPGHRFAEQLSRGLSTFVDPTDVVIIYTDESATARTNRQPSGAREIWLGPRLKGVGKEVQQQTLVSLVRSLRAESVVNVDSRLFYDALAPYGKALAQSERIFLCFLGTRRRLLGYRSGWSLNWFYPTFAFVEGVLVASEHAREALTTQFQLSPVDAERIHVLPTPVPKEIVPPPLGVRGERAAIFFEAAVGGQSLAELATEVARDMPEADFIFWGPAQLFAQAGSLPANVELKGRPYAPSEGGTSAPDAWLHADASDEAPWELLGIIASGVPVVSSAVGGYAELLGEEGWAVEQWQSPDAYAGLLRALLGDLQGANDRAGRLRERLLRERDSSSIGARAVGLLIPSATSSITSQGAQMHHAAGRAEGFIDD